jgi:hypothetical protein
MIQPTDSALITEPLSRSDMQLIGQAVRKGWKIPDNLLAGLPAALVKIVAEGKPRDKIAAARVLVKMQESNAEAEKPPAVVAHAHAHVHRVENSESPANDSSSTSNRRAALAARIARLR